MVSLRIPASCHAPSWAWPAATRAPGQAPIAAGIGAARVRFASRPRKALVAATGTECANNTLWGNAPLLPGVTVSITHPRVIGYRRHVADVADEPAASAHSICRWAHGTHPRRRRRRGCRRNPLPHRGTLIRLFRDRFQFCSSLVDLVVCVACHGGGGHCLAPAGERFVGLVAERVTEVGDRGRDFRERRADS